MSRLFKKKPVLRIDAHRQHRQQQTIEQLRAYVRDLERWHAEIDAPDGFVHTKVDSPPGTVRIPTRRDD